MLDNLLAERHIRGYGGIAYHHVADNYIALFSHFIPCGVWEAVYIIEGLLRQQSHAEPDTIHADGSHPSRIGARHTTYSPTPLTADDSLS